MSDDELVIGGQLGNYVIESVIGRGGMSVVYRARHSRLGMWVALKVLAAELGSDDGFRERFLREAQMASAVEHPNVIPIHDVGVHDGSIYIVMRHVSGGDLKSLLAQSPMLDPSLASAILTPVALALDAAHATGLVHRDVKPANVLIQRSQSGEIEHVYLTDFGIAKSTSALTGLTGTGVFIGTIEYMAPEQMEAREIGPQTDVYALGATLYQCLTGRVPFQRELAEGIRPAIGDPQSVTGSRPELPAAVDEIFAKALARHPVDRYESCEELMREFAAALRAEDAGVPAAPFASTMTSPALAASGLAASDAGPAPGAPADAHPRDGASEDTPPQPARRSRRGALIGVLGIVLLAAVGAAIVLATSGSGSPAGRPSSATLGQVPTNHVTGSGTVSLRLDGNRATVTLTTSGLDDGAPLVHAMHIHAGGKGECPPASAARLHNGHLAIDTNDGINYYGPPVQALTTRGDTSVGSILVFSRYPTGGTIRYSRTIALPAAVARYIRENDAVIVIHGIDYDHSGIYSGVLDRSDLDATLPATATAPALCGRLVGPQELAAAAPRAARPVLYTASLAKMSLAEAFLCLAPGSATTPAGERRRSAGKLASAALPSA